MGPTIEEPEKPKGFKYTDGSILIAHESGYRRHGTKPLSKRERAKIKRKAKRRVSLFKMGQTPGKTRIGAFFA